MGCPYCQSTQSGFLYSTYPFNGVDFSINQCRSCKCIHLDPLPNEETLNMAYSSEYYGEGDAKFIKPVEKFIGYFVRKRALLIHKLLKGEGRVLDMGCGNGKFLHNLSQLGNYDVHGIERPGNSAERAKKITKITVHEGEIDRVDLGGKFNAITLFHVFEHLTNPSLTIEKIDELLLEGGFLIITIPNIGSSQAKLFKGFWFHIDVPRHIFFFKSQDFEMHMNKKGYTLLSQNSYSLEHSIWGFYQSLMNWLFRDRDLFFEILKGKGNLLRKKWFAFMVQLLLLIIVGPLAFVEFVISGFLGKGVHKEFVFKKS